MAQSRAAQGASSIRRTGVVPKPVIRAVPFGDWPTKELTLSAPDREILRSIAVFQRLPARTRLFEQGTPATYLYNVLSGCVYSERRLTSGAHRGMALLLPGDLCGLAARGLYVNSTRTLADTELLKMPLDQLKAVLLGNANLQMFFLCKAAHTIRESQRQLLLLSREDPTERLALLVATLRRSLTVALASSIAMPAMKHELGSYLDLTPAQLSRALATLAADGVIEYARGTLRIVGRPKGRHHADATDEHEAALSAPARHARVEGKMSTAGRRRRVSRQSSRPAAR
jgi:CRP-like cAMP-binding protein